MDGDIKMLKTPLMSKVFDVFEQSRAIPNGKTPFNNEIMIIKNIPYKKVGDQLLVMDLYLPNDRSKKVPVVYDIPGGGWMIHNRERRDGYARLFAVMGAAVAVIDHRLCPKIFFPENLKDCIDGLNFLKSLETKYNLDLNDVTVTGDSSGGHLTACVGCAASSDEYTKKLGLPAMEVKPKRLICISGAFSFEIMLRLPTHTLEVRYATGQPTRTQFRKWEFYKESIPYNYLSKDFPPTYNSGGALDLLCLGEAKRMATKLDEFGVDNEYYVGKNIRNADHCYVLRLPFSPARADMLKLLTWYYKKENEFGFDMTQGYNRVKTFLENYKATLKGDMKC